MILSPENLFYKIWWRKKVNFNTFKSLSKFASNIYNGKIKLEEAKKDQDKMLKKLKYLQKYDTKNLEKIKSREETLIEAKELHNNRDNVIKAFEDGIFPFKDGFYQTEESDVADKALPD